MRNVLFPMLCLSHCPGCFISIISRQCLATINNDTLDKLYTVKIDNLCSIYLGIIIDDLKVSI